MRALTIGPPSDITFIKIKTNMKRTACMIGALILTGCAGIGQSDQCPAGLRHGQHVPVCASQAISPPTAAPSAQTASSPAAASATSSSSPMFPHEQVVKKDVGGRQIICHIPRPHYPSEALRAHPTGKIIVRITVWPPNIVKQLTLIDSGGDRLLDAAAMRAAEGTVCTDTEQRFQLFQPFEFNVSKSADVRAAGNATTPVR